MRHFDFSPLYRASVGFDHMADMMDRLMSQDAPSASYPPYNIEKTSDEGWRISVAVAGFSEADLAVEVKDRELVIAAKRAEEEPREYLHRGIATRAFERRFHLADHVRISGASHADGMLHIDLLREVPEALKPRRIAINASMPEAIEA